VPQVLAEDERQQIIEAAERIAARVPLRVTGASSGGSKCTATDQFLALLREFGCAISDDQARVHFPAEVIDRVLERIAAHKAAMPTGFPDFSDTLSYSASGQALLCQGPRRAVDDGEDHADLLGDPRWCAALARWRRSRSRT
jgi:hypothetical protein